MPNKRISAFAVLAVSFSSALLADRPAFADPAYSVGPQYDTTHVYVAPDDIDQFVKSFTETFGGASTKQVVVTVTPTPSSTSSQLVQTPAGTVSLFGFKTPIPAPFGKERNGFLVTDFDKAVEAARAAGAILTVAPFPDPIGRDAVVQWPGGVNMQLYWHNTKPNYEPLKTVPENRVYLSPDAASAFTEAFLKFSGGKVVSDDKDAAGVEIGRPDYTFRRIRIDSNFGKMVLLVTDGHLPFPYGHEVTGYETDQLTDTLARAEKSGAKLLAGPYDSDGRAAAMVSFPGGYIAEIHSLRRP
ncbi:glyoxalase [Neorhizobium lilium]|uniref:Glyoxalase n=1 Tax=Neorhizobium lilium TaxID=2503024 RepID=A0A3S3RM26_9HYPH|nr:glyoxalase [Neorhizobium lilium]RWX81851.1 glyoxalase [Neorhizobium lilium]